MTQEPLDLKVPDDDDVQSAVSPLSDKSSRKIPETLLKTVLSNLESAKKDLDKHWMYLTIATAISLGIVAGLGALVSKRVLGEASQEGLLFLLVPLVNLYLFMRFGFLLAYFSGVRLAAEDLSVRYLSEEGIRSEALSPHLLFGTNSYFEYIHDRQRSLGVAIYSLIIPLTCSLNHAASLVLLWRYFGGASKYVVVSLYGLALLVLCFRYYESNRQRSFNVVGSRSIAIYVFLDLLLTVLFVWLIAPYGLPGT